MVKHNSLLLMGLAMPLFIFGVCNGSHGSADDTAAKADTTAKALAFKTTDAVDTTFAAPPAAPPGTASPQSAEASLDFLLVKEATLELNVPEITHTADKLRRWVSENGGYYSNWSQGQVGDQLSLELTAKIPSTRFETFKDSVRSLGMLQRESGNMADLMDSLFQVLSTLSLQGRLQGQYAQLSQRIRHDPSLLSNQEQVQAAEEAEAGANLGKMLLHREAAISTVHVRLYTPHPLPAAPFFPRLGNSLSEGLVGVENVIVFLAALWPLALLGLLALMSFQISRRLLRKIS